MLGTGKKLIHCLIIIFPTFESLSSCMHGVEPETRTYTKLTIEEVMKKMVCMEYYYGMLSIHFGFVGSTSTMNRFKQLEVTCSEPIE